MSKWIKITIGYGALLVMCALGLFAIAAFRTSVEMIPVPDWIKVLIVFLVCVMFGGLAEWLHKQEVGNLTSRLKSVVASPLMRTVIMYASLLFGGYLLLSSLMPHSSRGMIYYNDAPWKVIFGILLLIAGLTFLHLGKKQSKP